MNNAVTCPKGQVQGISDSPCPNQGDAGWDFCRRAVLHRLDRRVLSGNQRGSR